MKSFLDEYVPAKLRNIATDKTMLYLGFGTDVWIPYGICDAKHVIAYDMIDTHWLNVLPSEHISDKLRPSYFLNAYAQRMVAECYNLCDGTYPKKLLINRKIMSFRILFELEGSERTFTCFIRDFKKVTKFPKAYGVIMGGRATKTFVKRVVEESQSKFSLQQGAEEGNSRNSSIVRLRYPSSLSQFDTIFEFFHFDYLLPNLSAKCRKDAFKSLKKHFDEYYNEPYLFVDLRGLK